MGELPSDVAEALTRRCGICHAPKAAPCHHPFTGGPLPCGCTVHHERRGTRDR